MENPNTLYHRIIDLSSEELEIAKRKHGRASPMSRAWRAEMVCDAIGDTVWVHLPPEDRKRLINAWNLWNLERERETELGINSIEKWRSEGEDGS